MNSSLNSALRALGVLGIGLWTCACAPSSRTQGGTAKASVRPGEAGRRGDAIGAPAQLSGDPAATSRLAFRHHFIARDLPVSDRSTGDYGLTALVDLDRDGDLDFVLGGRGRQPSTLYWFEFHSPGRWTRHQAGTNYLSDVGLTALDVDRDGWMDLVCSGVWYRNAGRPNEPFTSLVFDDKAAGAHDILTADLNGDGRLDVVMMGDERTELNLLCWYSIPNDPKQS